MKASILTFSQTGNTLKVGRAIESGLRRRGVQVKQTGFLRRRQWAPADADLIGVGCPCFENRPAHCVTDFLRDQRDRLRGRSAFVFITSGGSPANTLWHLGRAVRRAGATVLGGLQLRGAVTVPTKFGDFLGRPDAVDLDHAAAFGHALAARLLDGRALPAQYTIRKNGGWVYAILGPVLTVLKKLITPLPTCDAARCELCGICVSECPTDTIAIKRRRVVFEGDCMVCYRCWHVCPTNAISVRFSPGSGWIERTLYSPRLEAYLGKLEADEVRCLGPNLYRDVLSRRIKLDFDGDHPTAEFTRIDDRARLPAGPKA